MKTIGPGTGRSALAILAQNSSFPVFLFDRECPAAEATALLRERLPGRTLKIWGSMGWKCF